MRDWVATVGNHFTWRQGIRKLRVKSAGTCVLLIREEKDLTPGRTRGGAPTKSGQAPVTEITEDPKRKKNGGINTCLRQADRRYKKEGQPGFRLSS